MEITCVPDLYGFHQGGIPKFLVRCPKHFKNKKIVFLRVGSGICFSKSRMGSTPSRQGGNQDLSSDIPLNTPVQFVGKMFVKSIFGEQWCGFMVNSIDESPRQGDNTFTNTVTVQ
jgi:hypothetical protein